MNTDYEKALSKFTSAQNSLVVQSSDFSLLSIVQMIENNSIDVAPHYQRRERWEATKQSALIESFLLNVPVPPIYLSEDDYGNYSVIDGKQRITAVYDFINGKLKLKDLKEFPELNGYLFTDLPLQLQNALMVRPYLRVITLLRQSSPELKYEVFLRLNTGGEKLKAQEIRNVAFQGPFNETLYRLSNNEFLKQQLKIFSDSANAYRNMDDLEHVLRFFTVENSWSRMGGNIAYEMDKFMDENKDNASEEFENKFIRAISFCEEAWGNLAFKKPVGDTWRDQLISPLYDAQMVAAALLSDAQLEAILENKDEVIVGTRILFEHDSDFLKSVSQATNNSSAIRIRISKMLDLLTNISGN